MNGARTPTAVLAIVAAGLLVAGCGGDEIDTGQMEQDLVGQLSLDAGVDPAEVSVECPEGEGPKRATSSSAR